MNVNETVQDLIRKVRRSFPEATDVKVWKPQNRAKMEEFLKDPG